MRYDPILSRWSYFFTQMHVGKAPDLLNNINALGLTWPRKMTELMVPCTCMGTSQEVSCNYIGRCGTFGRIKLFSTNIALKAGRIVLVNDANVMTHSVFQFDKFIAAITLKVVSLNLIVNCAQMRRQRGKSTK